MALDTLTLLMPEYCVFGKLISRFGGRGMGTLYFQDSLADAAAGFYAEHSPQGFVHTRDEESTCAHWDEQ